RFCFGGHSRILQSCFPASDLVLRRSIRVILAIRLPPAPNPSGVSAHQVEQREQEYPDDVYKVPIQPEILHKCEMAFGIGASDRLEKHENQNADAYHHVQSVHARHGEVEEKVLL